MLKEVSILTCQLRSLSVLLPEAMKVGCLQFPRTVAQLCARLADVEMTDL